MRLVALVFVLAACGSKESAPQQGSASGSSALKPGEEALPKPEFKIEQLAIPADAGWPRAVKVATSSWAQSFNKLGVTTAKVSQLKAPDGTSVPFMLEVEAKQGDTVVYKNVAVVFNDRMINGSGTPYVEKHLASIGFPGTTKLHVGHLVEELFLISTLDRSWFSKRPSKDGWNLDATVIYDDQGALLTLFRDKDGPQKLEVRFDKSALITTTAYKKTGETWERFTE